MPGKLTNTAIRNAKPGPKPQRLFDGGGMYLEISPAGGKLWRLKFRFGGKEKRLALGAYPAVGLADARDKAEAARKLLAQGVDPSAARKAEKAGEEAEAETFATLALDWFGRFRHTFTAKHGDTVMHRLKTDVFPWLGHRPVREITAPEILAVVRRIEDRGAAETARRQLQKIGQILAFAVATGRAERNPAADLRGAVPPPAKRHFAALTDSFKVAELLKDIDAYQGSHVVRCALRLAPLLFVRPGELRHAEWAEFELDGRTPLWRIPPEKMKMRRQHLVPLAPQAVAILRELHPLTGAGKYLFPGNRPGKIISENTLGAALRTLGYTSEEMTAHGFRAMASTMLNEIGWPPDVIEAQLAHAPKNAIRAAYNRAQYLSQRIEMMESWADFLDRLKASDGGKVLPLFKSKSA
ncbi:MAG TPA: integrase arm-type DNA-binding domain-containing protein [Desulfovibrio sp.]|uniref:tyrosine-type recombinase/integrase n=1 Tax=Desulfovibrio sp. TaxID=885 RepID=UPI002C6EC40E|nr:integrase arm-type DNA-binding domain-containing protein [Desulfovibrio sp.]HMM38187.1 integrase arm-type DNA-binding domain-containing protein [Desulfovibrio sp.]